jgi:hypothetical protein
MDVALLDLVGAGIAAYAAGSGIDVPPGCIARGHDLVRHLVSEGLDTAAPLAERVVGELLGEWEKAGLPAGIIEHHAVTLPGLMDRFRPPSETCAEVVAAAKLAPETGEAGARLLAWITIAAAAKAGEIGRRQLTEAAAIRMLEQVYRRILAAGAEIEPLLPATAAYFTASDQPPAAEAAVPPEAALPASAAPEKAPDTGPPPLPPAIPEDAIRRELAAQLGSGRALDAALPRSIADCRWLLAELERPLEDATDEDGLRGIAREHVLAGELAEADAPLAQLEDHAIRLAQADLDLAGQHLTGAAAVRCMRARIESMRGDCRRAARHLQAAVRCLPMADQAGRARVRIEQALMLMRHGELQDDGAALGEAAAIFAELVHSPLAERAPSEWADAQLTLAQLLCVLAEREPASDLHAEAVGHARAAIAAMAAGQASPEHARAHLVLAEALRGVGDRTQSVAHLAEAVESYALALRVLGADRAPADRARARAGLGLARLRLGEIEGADGELDACLAEIGAALAEAETPGARLDVARLLAGRGRALLALFALRDQPTLARDAADALRASLGASDPAARPEEVTATRHRLALALWVIGGRSGDADVLREAAEELTVVLGAHERAGAVGRAEAARDDLARLEGDISRLSGDATAPAAGAAEAAP